MLSVRRYGIRLVLVGVTVMLVGVAAQAQVVEPASDGSARGGVGIHLASAFPAGDLQRSLETRFGLGGFGTLWLNDAGTIGLRLDGSLFFLGRERRTAGTLPGRISLVGYEITTKSDMLIFTLGPQFSKRIGSVMPYLTIGAGPSYVWTTEDVRALHGSHGEPVASNELAGNGSTAWQVGGGLYVQVDEGGFVGLSVHYLDGGHLLYIPPNSVRSGPNGTTSFSMVETDMRYIVVQISLSGWRGL